MQWLVILTLLTTCLNEAHGACSGDNCLRAVRREPSASRNGTADCISFFKVTVTPTPSTFRSTVTVTTTLLSTESKKRGIPELAAMHDMRSVYGPVHMLQVLPGNTLHKRQTTVYPTAIPAYATACSSLAAYSSACSCLAVPRTTVTAAAGISTSILTVTETVTPPSLPTRVVNITATPSSTTARPTTLSSNSTGIYANTSSTSTSSATSVLDTTCGETATPFNIQVSQPGGLFDSWYAHLSGNGVLFTSDKSSATSFSVEGSGHLCAVGYEGQLGYPIIAVVTNLTASGAVWLLDARRAQAFSEDYVPVECARGSGSGGGGGLACRAGSTSHWLGCGLQLDLSSDAGEIVVVDGLNCSAITLEAV